MPITNHFSNSQTNISLLEDTNKTLQQNIDMLNAKQEPLECVQEVGQFSSWELDLETHTFIWSEQSYRIYKLDPNTTSPTLETFTSRVIEEDQEKLAQGMASLADGKIHTITLRVRREDGVIITVLMSGKYIFDESNKPVKIVGTTLDITELITLKQKNEELISIIEDSSNEIYIINLDTFQYLYANQQALKTLGYSREEMCKMNIFDINKSLSLKQANVLKAQLIQNGTLYNRTIHTKKNGETYPVQSYIQYRDYQNQKVGIIFDLNIAELIEVENKHKLQAQILEQIQDSVIATNLKGIITQWNRGASKLHGYHPDEIIGKHIYNLYPESEHQKVQWIQQQTLLHGTHNDQIKKLTKDGNLIYTNITTSILKDERGEIIGIIRYSQDITHKKEIEKKLQKQTALLNFQAYHDTLTALPNRALFDDRLQQSIANAHQHDEKFALFFIDLDNFKQINDTLGHHYGDQILKIVAKRLAACIEENDTIARIGGDEFTLLRQNLITSESASSIAENILRALKPKIVLDGHTLHITASIGISLYPKDSTAKNDLLKYADTAMYKAKEEGRDNYQFYSSEMTRVAFEKAIMESALHRAIEEKQFVVYYQPQIDSRTHHIVGLEALVRWNHPEMGLVMPDKFIGIAEASSFIQELDNYVMLQAMIDIENLYRQGMNPGILSLNLSIKQLLCENFLEILKKTISRTNFNVSWLEFEITESQMMHDPQKAIKILQTISDMGIQISIDDFGTGYSSLTYLKKLPVNKLKIDKSFIQNLPHDEEDAAIINAVIALAKSLKLSFIAEGVENKKQLDYLMEQECYLIQGHYYAKALSISDITIYIQKNVSMSLE